MNLSKSISSKLEELKNRFEEISRLLSDPEVVANREKFTQLSKEFSELEPIVICYEQIQMVASEISDNQSLIQDASCDNELRELAQEEIKVCESKLEALENEIRILLIPKDPNDQSNVYLEIRAGTGGDEAAIFSGNLFRMYQKYCESQGSSRTQRSWAIVKNLLNFLRNFQNLSQSSSVMRKFKWWLPKFQITSR